MNRAPVFIEVALWYYTRGSEHPSVLERAPAYTDTVRQMVGLGLLVAKGETMGFMVTTAMKVYIEALCAVPTPVQRWVIPSD